MKNVGFSRLAAAALLAAVLVVASCSGEDKPHPASGQIVLYTSMPSAIIDQLEGVFEGAFPDFQGNTWVQPGADDAGGITLEVVRGRTADLQARIDDEVASGGVQADVIWLAEPSPYETYKDMGLLAPYRPPEDAPISGDFVDPDGYYVAGRVIAMVLAWNSDLADRPLMDWSDLLGVGLSAFPAPESGAARATISALLDLYGEGYFGNLWAVGGVAVPSNGAARDGLTSGMFEAVAVLDYMVRLAQANGASVEYAYPRSGTVIIPSPLAITAGATNPDAARVFVDYVLSKTGQEIVVELGSFYPVRSDVAVPPNAPPLGEVVALEVDWTALADETTAIAAMWESVFGAPVAVP
jgi:iron(III) transport system substrate-binding protein